MDVYVLTRGFLLDHTLVGVFTDLDTAKRAADRPSNLWVEPAPGMWTSKLHMGDVDSDQGWAIEQRRLDAPLQLTEVT